MLIEVKSIPIVQEIYKNILNDTEISFNTILKHSKLNDLNNHNIQIDSNVLEQDRYNEELNLIRNKHGIKLLYNIKHAETSFIFNLCIFGKLGNAKNNLIFVSDS